MWTFFRHITEYPNSAKKGIKEVQCPRQNHKHNSGAYRGKINRENYYYFQESKKCHLLSFLLTLFKFLIYTRLNTVYGILTLKFLHVWMFLCFRKTVITLSVLIGIICTCFLYKKLFLYTYICLSRKINFYMYMYKNFFLYMIRVYR